MKSTIRQWLVEGLRLRAFRHAPLAAFSTVLLLSACSDATGPTHFVSITPASQSVALQTVPGGKVLRTSLTLRNTSSFPVTWDYCGLTLERKIVVFALASDGPTPPWFTVWSATCALLSAEAVAIIRTPLEPGQSVTIPIEVPVAPTGAALFDGSPGEYRVHLVLAAQITGRRILTIPHDASVSDSFSVVAQ
jgi:hypothetical protein